MTPFLRNFAGRRVSLPVIALLLLTVGGCLTPDEYRQQADDEAYGIVSRARVVAGQKPDPDFSVEPSPDRLRGELMLAYDPNHPPVPAERLALDGESVTVDLETALAIASRNSRDFQDQKERLYSVALALTGRLQAFENNYFGTPDFDVTSVGDGESDASVSIARGSNFGFTRMLEAGGALSLSIGDDLTRFLTNPASTAATSFVNFTLSLPFLRGAGRDIAYEGVTQAERDVIYAVRTFERFKRTFAVDIISAYLRLLQSMNSVENAERDYARREATAIENRALGEAGRISRTDVERANQALLTAENSLIGAEQSLANALDDYKFQIGLPTDCNIAIDPTDLDRLKERGLDARKWDMTEATVMALEHRLDYATAHGQVIDSGRKVVVAADALQAGVDFSASVDLQTDNYAERSFKLDPLGDANYGIGLDLDLPFERTAERNAYRLALIDYNAAREDFDSTEDGVKLDVRRNLRALKLASESYRIQVAAERVSLTNVDASKLLKDAGDGTTNDLLDAQNDLVAAQNNVTRALIDYTTTRLRLLRDIGVLVVGADGIDYESTQRIIEGE